MIRLAIVAIVGLAGCPSPEDTDTGGVPTPSPDRVDTILALSGDPIAGQNRFTGQCVACHPADGSTGAGPALSVAIPILTDEEIVATILDGGTAMPTFDHLDDPEIADILAFTRSEWD